MCSGVGTGALPPVGSPIRRSPDQSLLGGSPKLIAACHVLHRLLAPRHPPYALSSLVKTTSSITVQFSRYDPESRAHLEDALTKTNPIIIISPRSIGYPATRRPFFRYLASWNFIKPPTMGTKDRMIMMIHTGQFMPILIPKPKPMEGLKRMPRMVNSVPAAPHPR